MDVVTGLAPNDSDVLGNVPRETDFAKRDTEMDFIVESADRRESETHVVPEVTREVNTVKGAGSRRNSETIDVHVRQRQKRARGKWGDRKVCTGNGETTMTAGHVDISTPSNDKRFLRRVRSATFITPAPQPDFTLRRRKRKCLEDADAVSLCSLDMKEPSSKRVRPLSRVASLASLITPVKGVNVRRFGQNLQRSISLRADGPGPACAAKPYSKQSVPTTPRHRLSRLWSDTYKAGVHHELSRTEIKRQEAIFELAQGEHDLIDDLKLAKKAYHDPMLKLNIMSKEELNEIFGALESLIPLHEALLSQLHKARLPDGTTESIGQILVEWLPCLHAYSTYCSNQVAAKALLDRKKRDPRVGDFLRRCLESPFSRKLELWSFLDVPRSRLVKYPLLLREILRHTPADHSDRLPLEDAVDIVQGVAARVNELTGESECRHYLKRLDFLDERQREPLLANCRVLHCHGELRNNRGTKLYVLLFSEVLVLSRPVARAGEHRYLQVYRQPLPLRDLVLEDLQDGEVRFGGSFRGAFSSNEKAKNIFRVGVNDLCKGHSHSLQARDSYSKQQWLNSIRNAVAALSPQDCPTPQPAARSFHRPPLSPIFTPPTPQAKSPLQRPVTFEVGGAEEEEVEEARRCDDAPQQTSRCASPTLSSGEEFYVCDEDVTLTPWIPPVASPELEACV